MSLIIYRQLALHFCQKILINSIVWLTTYDIGKGIIVNHVGISKILFRYFSTLQTDTCRMPSSLFLLSIHHHPKSSVLYIYTESCQGECYQVESISFFLLGNSLYCQGECYQEESISFFSGNLQVQLPWLRNQNKVKVTVDCLQ